MVDRPWQTATAFHTRLGWLGIVWHVDRVSRVSFGHRSKTSVLDALDVQAWASQLSPRQLEIKQRLCRFADGDCEHFDDVALDLAHLTAFQQRVLYQCRKLRWGDTCTYGALARRTGRPGAARAVGTALARNPIPIVVPCHRIVSGCGLGGFSAPGGLRTKQKMLIAEGCLLPQLGQVATS